MSTFDACNPVRDVAGCVLYQGNGVLSAVREVLCQAPIAGKTYWRRWKRSVAADVDVEDATGRPDIAEGWASEARARDVGERSALQRIANVKSESSGRGGPVGKERRD